MEGIRRSQRYFRSCGGTSKGKNFFTTFPMGTLPEAVKDGFSPNGWYDAPEGGNKIDTSYNPSVSAVIYARWTENSYGITFDSGGGTGAMDSIGDILCTATLTLPANTFLRDGHYFAGWHTDGLTPLYADGGTVSRLADGGNVTLYAVWRTSPSMSLEDPVSSERTRVRNNAFRRS